MSEEDRIELKKELSIYSKEELLEKYIDELEENLIITDQWYKSSQRLNNIIKEVRELLKNDYFEDGSFTSEEKVFELLDKGE